MFSPQATMTRAMMVTILARMAGVDTDGAAVWYEPGVSWAVEKGISDGTNPGGLITREQLATMLYRSAGEPETTGTLDGFTDREAASAYAETALCWAVEKGILTGKGNGILDPAGFATRAEVAVMLMRIAGLTEEK